MSTPIPIAEDEPHIADPLGRRFRRELRATGLVRSATEPLGRVAGGVADPGAAPTDFSVPRERIDKRVAERSLLS